MPPEPPMGYRPRRAFIRTPLRQILDPPPQQAQTLRGKLLIKNRGKCEWKYNYPWIALASRVRQVESYNK